AAFAALEGAEPGTSGEIARVNGLDWPQPYVNLPRLSPDMQSVWERLERSGAFEPRAWRAWHQLLGREQRSQAVRIHDQQVLRGDWLQTLSVGPLDPADDPGTERGMLVRGGDWLPEPEFRLDGSIRIYQTQFMHAASNLTWREPIESDLRPLVLDHLEQGLFRQHRLEQSRAIRPGRLEYFDSSWLGILLKVTPLEIQGEPAENPDGS
ncbi:MAG: CsiV family protein, partial [Wenzhouxiangella sp.]|nr:CsiV family protein [Wenzhouxiangella sp.]